MNKIGFAFLGTAAVVSANAQSAQQTEIDSLFETQDWNTLRSIWRLLDRMDPGDDYYGYPMDTVKGDSIASVLNGLFPSYNFDNIEIYHAANMVRGVAVMRTMRLSRINPMMMTRMMPPWTSTVQEDLLFNFEQRITTLTELLHENEISASEYITARDTLMDKALTLALLEIINHPRRVRLYDYPFMEADKITADSILHRLDMSYRAALDTLNKVTPSEYIDHYREVVDQHELFLEEYGQFREAAPVFRLLLENLMEARP